MGNEQMTKRKRSSPHGCIIREKTRIFIIRRGSTRIARALAGGLLRTCARGGAGRFTGGRFARDGLAALKDLATEIRHGGGLL